MAEIVGHILGRVAIELVGAAIQGALQSRQSHPKNSTKSLTNTNTSKSRAVLLSSSNIEFGNACERLINIAFQTSQSFPTIMSTYADITRYLCTELSKQYRDVHFQIIIGPNEQFGFSVDENQYFAEIAHEKYRVLIFSTTQNSKSKFDTNETNCQMLLNWK